MKIATFNIQNIFHRNTHLVKQYAEDNKDIWIQEFENLKRKYRPNNKDYTRMRDLSILIGFHSPTKEPYLTMRRKSGQLYIQKGELFREYKANHLTDWNGWVKLSTTPINEIATQNKARVIDDVNPDILLLQEVEDRVSLLEFNNEFLSKNKAEKFEQIIYLETNDNYGRGMAILTKKGYQIESMKTYVNDKDNEGNSIFNFDFQQYNIKTPTGESIQLLATHLTEGSLDSEESNNKRKAQSEKIVEVYENLQKTTNLIAVLGTLNAPSYSDSISPLIKEVDLKDITKHKFFILDFNKDKEFNHLHSNTYRMGVNIKQRNYLLLSPFLFKSIKNSSLFRRGIWNKEPSLEIMYKSIKKEIHMASQHPLIWCEI